MMNVEKIKEMLTKVMAELDERQDSDVAINSTTQFVVKSHDEPESMTWHDAMKKFGPDGTDKEWRLPTRFELAVMYQEKASISNLADSYYWSSTEYSYDNAWDQRFSDGSQDNGYKYAYYLVRCVRR